MRIFRFQTDLRAYLSDQRNQGLSIGFVPTMGALHEGHLSLLKTALTQTEIGVVSIFVNPTQFNDTADLEKYPRTPGADIGLLEAAGCQVLYLPDATDVYDGRETATADLGGLDAILEGASRPGHFAGVAQVVGILLDIVQPDKLFMGQKDYQQIQVVNRMLAQRGDGVVLVMCPIVREENGLAMSSRNRRLSAEGRERAGQIYRTLQKAAREAVQKELPVIELESREHLDSQPDFAVDYFSFRHPQTLEPLRHPPADGRMVLVTAVLVEGVRLLDNVLVV